MNVRDFVNYFRSSRVVRVAFIYVPVAWVTLRAILITISGFDAPGWVPKLLGILLLIGYPVALVVSWAMDVGDEEASREAPANKVYVPGGGSAVKGQQTTATSFGVFLFAGLVILGGAVYLMLNPELPIKNKTESENTSIAVLPFLNLSSDSGHQIFCDGLSEELLNLLTHVSSLRVAARTSSFSMRNSELDIPAIGKKLGVNHILEGSVRRDGEEIRVTAQLVRTSDGIHLWSQNYDRQFTKIFEIQDDIAKNIVAQLVTSFGSKAGFDGVTAIERTNPEAYFAYLQGRGALNYPGPEKLLQATQYFDAALEISPDFEPARIGQLYSRAMLGVYKPQTIDSRRDLFSQADRLFDTNEDEAWLASAIAMLGISLYEWERAQEVLELALGANLNDARISMLHAELLLTLKDIDGARREIQRIKGFAPGVAALAYLSALVDYDASFEALEELFVRAEGSRDWSVGGVPGSAQESRRQLFRDCSDLYAAPLNAATDVSACSALESFSIPLLALHNKNSAALQQLVSMIEMRTFDGSLTHMPEVAALLALPEASVAREILGLPASDAGENMALVTR